jgi:hypothetical protein
MNQELLDSLFEFETYAKIGMVLATAPIWWPTLKLFWREMDDALAPDGGFLGARPPAEVPRRALGLDPWHNVPHSTRRSAQNVAASGTSLRGASRGARRNR